MDNNSFEEYKDTYFNILQHHGAARKSQDKSEMRAVQNEYKALEDSVNARGKHYAEIFKLYKAAWDRGNDLPNFEYLPSTDDVEALSALFKEFGVRQFTTTATYNLIEVADLFQENGYRLEGVIQIKRWIKLNPYDSRKKKDDNMAALLFGLVEDQS